MPTLIENLNLINSYKSDIKSAIEAKGVDMSSASFPDYASKIGEIQTGGVTETLSVTYNGTFYPGQGVDGFSQVDVNVPQTGFTQKDITEATYDVSYLNNSASFVAQYAFLQKGVEAIDLPSCNSVYDSAFYSCSKLSSISLPECTMIGSFAFNRCSSLTSINLPNCTRIHKNAFEYCSRLESISIPNLSYVSESTFAQCSKLASVYLPNVSMVHHDGFLYCRSLVTVDLPNCTFISNGGFANCFSLVSVNIPSCKILSTQAFYSCSILTYVNMPLCEIIGFSAFQGCSLLSSVSLGNCTYVNQYAFANCSSLSSINLSNCSYIGQYAFSGCSLLEELTLNMFGYTLVSYTNNMLSRTKLQSGIGSIYVPYALYSKYIVANGWSSISARFVSAGDPDYVALSFSDGLLYGSTNYIEYSFNSWIGISYSQVVDVYLPNLKVDAERPGYTPPQYVFRQECKNLKNYETGLSFIPSNYLQLHSKIETVSLPNCRVIYERAFSGCSNLSNVNIPLCEYIDRYAFIQASNVSIIDLNNCSYIGTEAFRSCSLTKFINRYDGVCTLVNSNVFLNTPIAAPAGNGQIFVPSYLVNSYKVAQNWSYYSSRILPILPDLYFDSETGIVGGMGESIDPTYLNTLDITASEVLGVSMSLLTSVASSTFMNHYNLVYFSIPLVTEYTDDMLNGCSALSVVDLFASSLGDRVFANCTGLETVFVNYSDALVSAGSDLFYNCPNLTMINVPYGWYSSYVSAEGWSQYSSLMVEAQAPLLFSDGLLFGATRSIDSTYRSLVGNISSNAVFSISLPMCEHVGSSTFYSHKSLTTVYLPNCMDLGAYAFGESPLISSIVLPKCEYIGANAFRGACQQNTTGVYMTLDLPVCSFIGASAFFWTQRSWTITLGYSSVVDLDGGSWVFSATTIRSLYVPASLVDTYKTAFGWSFYADKIFPIQE